MGSEAEGSNPKGSTPEGAQQKRIKREQAIAKLVRQYERQLRQQIENDPQTLDQIEGAAQELGEKIKRDFEEELLQSHGQGIVVHGIPVRVEAWPATSANASDAC